MYILTVKATMAKVSGKTRKNFRLSQTKLDVARRLLGTGTETETIEMALDLVAFGATLAEGTLRARGRDWNDPLGSSDAVPAPGSEPGVR